MASQGKTILITGSATVGATVMIHGRSRERAESLLGEIRKRGNNAAAFYQADLSSLAEVRELAARIRKEHERHVASAGQYPIDFEDVMLTRGYDGGRAYAQSKLAQVMFTVDLAHELEGSGVTVNCLHPDTYMDTTMVREGGISPISTVDEGAAAILNLVRSPALEGRSGLYFDRQRESRANPQAYDAAARDRLRRLSLELTGSAVAARK
jgi:NAD(P)-dependent dehydrogenase (short-subunit alcohol dehydrogenase family)